MKIRTDFVSNSSSSSFILMASGCQNGIKEIFRKIYFGDTRYPEFIPFLANEYHNVILKNHSPECRRLLSKLDDFINDNRTDQMCRMVVIGHYSDTNEYLKKLIYDLDDKTIEDVGIIRRLDTFKHHIIKSFNGKSYVKSVIIDGTTYDLDELDNMDGVMEKLNSDYFASYIMYWQNEPKTLLLADFIRTLDRHDFENFLNMIVSIFSYRQTDGYGDNVSPEVSIFEKYNLTVG